MEPRLAFYLGRESIGHGALFGDVSQCGTTTTTNRLQLELAELSSTVRTSCEATKTTQSRPCLSEACQSQRDGSNYQIARSTCRKLCEFRLVEPGLKLQISLPAYWSPATYDHRWPPMEVKSRQG